MSDCLHIGAVNSRDQRLSHNGKIVLGMRCPICRHFLIVNEHGEFKIYREPPFPWAAHPVWDADRFPRSTTFDLHFRGER